MRDPAGSARMPLSGNRRMPRRSPKRRGRTTMLTEHACRTGA